jgi:hypothetical protein
MEASCSHWIWTVQRGGVPDGHGCCEGHRRVLLKLRRGRGVPAERVALEDGAGLDGVSPGSACYHRRAAV